MVKKTSLKLIPLGGLSGIGKNMMVFEKDNQIIIVDCGIMFPDDDMPGIDFIIPEFSKIARAGEEGVLALLCDSTNAEELRNTLPEKDVGKTLLEKFEKASKRIIVATFSSHIHRIQQVLDVASKLDKKVAISGKSILKTIRVAAELGYLKIPEDTIIPISRIEEFPLKEIIILSTGSQGEPLSALNRMALGEHKRINIMEGDMVIISASPVPGNERAISNTINMLIKKGADVYYESIAGVHVSGHAAREEIKIMINMANPRYFIPIHGEDKHKIQNAQIAQSMGMDEKSIIIAEDGDIIKMNNNFCRISGNLHPQTIYVDGVGMGNIEDIVLKDRKILSRSGIMFIIIGVDYIGKRILCEPDFILKGIIYIENLKELLNEAKKSIKDTIKNCFDSNVIDKTTIEELINDRIEKFIFKKAEIRPIIITRVISPNRH